MSLYRSIEKTFFNSLNKMIAKNHCLWNGHKTGNPLLFTPL